MEDANEEQSTAIVNVPQQGVQVPMSTFEAAASSSGASLFGRVNISNSTVYMSTPSENRGNRPLQPSPSVDLDTIEFTELKEYYKTTLCQASPLPWYPDYTWDIDEVYTELSLHNAVTSKFGVEELFKHAHEHSRKGGSYRILIEGDAGFGKSTLMLKIASDWSKRDSNDHTEYTSPFSILFVVKLGYVDQNENLLSYMESLYNEKMDTPLKDVLKSKAAEEVLILLDGYDEANTNTKKEVGRIMVKEMMSKCHVMLTSRCGHVPDAVKGKALRVTVKGFGRRQVTVAVGKFFIMAGHVTKADVVSCAVKPVPLRESDSDNDLDDAIKPNTDDFKNVQEIIPLLPENKRIDLDQFKKFMKKVLDDSPYKELAQCPLLCVMLCCLVSECPNGELPKTCSGLYFAMINRNFCRAARKKAEAAGEDEEQWNWDELDSRIREGHESYLQDFGRLCMNGLKTRSMSFSLFDITGNKEAAKTTNVKVTQLIEAAVLVQDFTELNTKEKIYRYQVPHRTTAEFLAAYYLSREIDQDSLQQNLLDLFRLNASFDEVAVSLIEMEKSRCLANAFRDVKFSSSSLTAIPFLKSYFTQHGAAGTWSEFKDALPNKLRIETRGHDIIYSTSCDILQLIEKFVNMMTGNTNAFRSLPKDCLVSVQVERALNLPSLLQGLQSGVVLNSLEINSVESSISDEMQHEVARSLQELLKDDFCPVQLSFTEISPEILLAVTEAMQEVPEACRLRSFELSKCYRGVKSSIAVMRHTVACFLKEFLKPKAGSRRPVKVIFPNASQGLQKALIEAVQEIPEAYRPSSFEFLPDPSWEPADTSPLTEVLAEKWLSHLQHLGIPSQYTDKKSVEPFNPSPRDSQSGGILNPILKRLTEPGCSLTSLHLYNSAHDDDNEGMLLEDLMVLVTKLETLRLEGMKFRFDVTRISKYALKEKCSLKSLHLENFYLSLEGSLPSEDENKELLCGWKNVALHLEELTIDDCEFPVELLSWLNLSVPNLRTLSIGKVVKRTPNRDSDFYANQLLEALTRSSGDSIEELSLLKDFWSTYKGLTLDPIEEALQGCPRMRKVKLEISKPLPESIGPDPSTSVSFSDVEVLNSDTVCLALLEIVLSVPMLQTLTSEFFFTYWEKIGTFRAIADNAKKWPGKSFDSECNTLTLQGLSNENACDAMHVFRERGLEHCLRYVRDNVYELWFPV